MQRADTPVQSAAWACRSVVPMLPEGSGKRMLALISRRSTLRLTLRASMGVPMKRQLVASSLAAIVFAFGAHAREVYTDLRYFDPKTRAR